MSYIIVVIKIFDFFYSSILLLLFYSKILFCEFWKSEGEQVDYLGINKSVLRAPQEKFWNNCIKWENILTEANYQLSKINFRKKTNRLNFELVQLTGDCCGTAVDNAMVKRISMLDQLYFNGMIVMNFGKFVFYCWSISIIFNGITK